MWSRAIAPIITATSVLVDPPDDTTLMTVDQAKLRAGLDWAAGDPREALLTGYISAARDRVEKDTGLALLTQGRDVYVDAWPTYPLLVIQMPDQCRPLQSVSGIDYVDQAGAPQTLDPSQYRVDLPHARIWRVWGSSWFYAQPGSIVIHVVAGYASLPAIPALLVHAHGLLVTHYATTGRDVATPDDAKVVPFGYDDAVASYRLVSVA